MDLQLSARVFCITGGSRGIGLAIANTLVQEGAQVALCGRDTVVLERAVKALGSRAFGFACDVLTATGVEDFVAASISRFGHVDGAIANVGGTFGKKFLETTAEDWIKTLELNLVHAARLLRAVIPQQKPGASNLVISSISGTRPGPRGQYGAAKAGEISMVQSLAKEFGIAGLRFNTLSPGSILFEGGNWAERQRAHPEKIAEFVKREFPAGRMGTLDEVANVAAFLLSEKSSWINGADIVVDGAQGHPSVAL
jgi:3-oxoacyl-[acyl-carrier protein] reductase